MLVPVQLQGWRHLWYTIFDDWTYRIGFSDIQLKTLECRLCMALKVFAFLGICFTGGLRDRASLIRYEPGKGAALICDWLRWRRPVLVMGCL